MEEDGEFVYLALERCRHSLADMLSVGPPAEALFVDSQAYPTPLCMQVTRLPSLPVCLLIWCLSVFCLPDLLHTCASVCLSHCLASVLRLSVYLSALPDSI